MQYLTYSRRFIAAIVTLFICLPLWSQGALRHLYVLSATDREPLPGVNIFWEKNRGVTTDINGLAILPANIPTKAVLTISYVGFETQRISLADLKSEHGRHTILLGEQHQLLTGITISGKRQYSSRTASATGLSSEDIQKHMGRSLAEVLEGISGISSIKTGTSSAKPVIHGMHGNRILIVNNGVRQSGQQWGEGHGPEVDMNSSHTIHVVKGAEGVRYGAEAMGGVIVMEQKPLPYDGARNNDFDRHISLQGATNGRSITTNLLLEGIAPSLPSLAWRIQTLYGNSGDHSTAHYLLNNTGERNLNLSATMGYKFRHLRVEASYSRYHSEHGILRSAQLGSVRIFYDRIRLGRPQPETITPWQREFSYPKENVTHHTLSTKVLWDPPHWGHFLYQISYQRDLRQEYRIRRLDSSVPEVDLRLSSIQNKLRWNKNYGAWQTEIGLTHQFTDNYSQPGTGVVPVIPNYTEQAYGAYLIQQYRGNHLSLEAGVRADGQSSHTAGYDIMGELYGGKRHFFNMSYNLGLRYMPSRQFKITSNLGIAWRAPHVYELYANGSDHGSAAYMLGDSSLKSEQSYKWVTSLEYHTPHITASVDGYLQWIDNYIYDEPQLNPDGTPELRTIISGAYPVFRYKQTKAFVRGLDFTLEVKPIEGLRYRLTTALIYANERPSGSYLPFISAPKIEHNLRYETTKRKLKPYVEIGHRFVSKQRRFEPHRDLVPDTPDAYHLISAEMGIEWAIREQRRLSVSLSGDNLFNQEYKEYTNRARYYSHDLGRDIRLKLAWHF